MDPAAAAASGQITAAHGAEIAGTPAVVWLSYALASGAGLVGAVLLLMGKPAAKIAFGLSLLSAAVFYLWVYGLSGTGSDRPSEEMIIGLVVIAVTSLFFALSRRFG
jgi:glucose dehydrogenase